ncbi:MAG: hypothetical protein ABIG46_01690 [Candidatus Omnitrophota bacterium]
MKRPAGLVIFWAIATLIDVVFAIILYPLFYLIFSRFIASYVLFIILVFAYFPALIIASIGLLKLKKWGRNIFVSLTIPIIVPTVLLLVPSIFRSPAETDPLLFVGVLLIFFTVLFINYFSTKSVRELFN